ncbi:Cullin-4 [Irineochytrium annulatum]|nr:Cullin-4 [Irineochytrium annulatum]
MATTNPDPKFPIKNATPIKKITIKGFKVKPKVPDDYEHVTWLKLKAAVDAIHASNPVEDSLEELYKSAEHLCHQKKAELTYNRLKVTCEEHVKVVLRELLTIFLYLDRTYVQQSAGLKALWDMGLDLFREHVLSNVDIRNATVEGLINMITSERNGNQITRDVVRSLLSMFSDLGMYVLTFEVPFIQRSEVYYVEEGERLVAAIDDEGSSSGDAVARYLRHIEARFSEEFDRCQPRTGYLGIGTRKSIFNCVELGLIRRHTGTILQRGFDKLMVDKRLQDLGLMYHMLMRADALDEIKKYFSAYIKNSGKTIVCDPARDAEMVKALLTFKHDLDVILQQSLDNNDELAKALKESFEYFINIRANKPAEMLAKHVDTLLRTSKGITEEEMEDSLDRCLVIFRYIRGKDVFEAFYKNNLAKRLLLARSASVDTEKSMLHRLKAECGAGFTSKLEGMFRDMELSRGFMTSFHESPKVKGILPCDMNLAQCQDIFKQFYMSKYNGRKISWQNQLGYCVLKGNFKKATKELSVSLFQAVVLLLFNDQPQLTFDSIASQVNMSPLVNGVPDHRELNRTLQSLACGKVRVLNKLPRGKDVNPTDSFEFNASFENPLYRIKVNSIQLKETVEENQETTEKVFADRQYQVDAAIVRIMKSRKKLSHQMLIAELFEQLKFPVKPTDLKKRIESLIDREYLDRDKEDTSSYIYMA